MYSSALTSVIIGIEFPAIVTENEFFKSSFKGLNIEEYTFFIADILISFAEVYRLIKNRAITAIDAIEVKIPIASERDILLLETIEKNIPNKSIKTVMPASIRDLLISAHTRSEVRHEAVPKIYPELKNSQAHPPPLKATENAI